VLAIPSGLNALWAGSTEIVENFPTSVSEHVLEALNLKHAFDAATLGPEED
jgi:hypothetical protein